MTNTKYYPLMLGKGSRHAEQCLAERFVGADYGIERDLSRELPDSWASSTRCSFLSIKKRIPKRPKLPPDLSPCHRVDERERLRALEYVHLFNIL